MVKNFRQVKAGASQQKNLCHLWIEFSLHQCTFSKIIYTVAGVLNLCFFHLKFIWYPSISPIWIDIATHLSGFTWIVRVISIYAYKRTWKLLSSSFHSWRQMIYNYSRLLILISLETEINDNIFILYAPSDLSQKCIQDSQLLFHHQKSVSLFA